MGCGQAASASLEDAYSLIVDCRRLPSVSIERQAGSEETRLRDPKKTCNSEIPGSGVTVDIQVTLWGK